MRTDVSMGRTAAPHRVRAGPVLPSVSPRPCGQRVLVEQGQEYTIVLDAPSEARGPELPGRVTEEKL